MLWDDVTEANPLYVSVLRDELITIVQRNLDALELSRKPDAPLAERIEDDYWINRRRRTLEQLRVSPVDQLYLSLYPAQIEDR